mmetsp:Transcript_19287/g.21534  ORF Transcript_19287/g.21534 Transcript_19287/m.21534 type:complete len:147 (+) Transcript_19287:154-594(+)|eukprot:CAMPEP_0194153902 /NCGR_PEP_ID=MMETSP0152-20130528/58429_1 /TAXON_ID=1049557 /ORGANISM="Thalassiothrix antarctica, Strain L6-D1" /LENGTH=146 /DNA_ID=CAMNT_0038859591 /DNA_START=159 /DNA_END=599 /DNA_ORIENTATION=+
MKVFALVLLSVLLFYTSAFTISSRSLKKETFSKNTYNNNIRQSRSLLKDNESEDGDLSRNNSNDETSYPIPLPSPVLLGSSMILGIVSVGSTFQLTASELPPIGYIPTVLIIVLGIPSCLYLFYASILKAQAETEEDDKKYMNDRY